MSRPDGGTPRVLEPACEWTADDLADDPTWTIELDGATLGELDDALRRATTVSDDVLDIGADQFPLPNTAALLAEVVRELIDGRGVVRLRGIDRSAYTQAEMEILYWGIGVHIGTPWEQNQHGHVLGDVTDQQRDLDDPTSRGNEVGGIALGLHSDGADLVGLMCLDDGRAGGESIVANAVTAHNHLVREAPDVAAVLYERFPYDFRGEQAAGARPYYQLPVFTEHADRLFVRCIPKYIESSQRHPEAPRISDEMQAALDHFYALVTERSNQVHMRLAPGDIQFINNYHVLHGRAAYSDDRAAGAVRHLKRLWLETDALPDRPKRFSRPVRSHWRERRSVSRLGDTSD